MKKESMKKIAWVTLFGIAMGFLEAAVVVYLRYLYYPSGFDFPLKGFIEPVVLQVEWLREAATIIMLAALGALVGRKGYEKFAYFMYSFAIWDIFYYISLKATLDWPASLATWDILFMIPLPWVGPVIAPVIVSLTMMALAWCIIEFEDAGKKVKLTAREWALLLVGWAIILYTFLYDYTVLIFGQGFASTFFTLATNPAFQQAIDAYIPQQYMWGLFWLGELLTIIAVVLFYRRTR